MTPIFAKHVFICLNLREKTSQTSCGTKNAEAVLEDMKAKIKSLNLNKKIRINRSGCLGQCEKGLTMVIYPQGIWYQHVKLEDVDEIIQTSILGDAVVERLLLQP